ncbi:MAG: hypothetical protein J6584_04345 [Lactobacillus sp.]|uniref:DUF6994 family protein n=1 Tax=Bombilactobacillus bombi TaxID=1303590 RepID=UPI0035EDE27A|nr:hypothetical protein [Lactobacillus sp.]
MKVYQENMQRLRAFYQSDYYQWLSNYDSKFIKIVREALYNDPDKYDVNLYKELAAKYHLPQKRCNLLDNVSNHSIKLSADVVCGSKQLEMLHPDFKDWILDYENIRSNINLHFLWPQHKVPTINTYRYTIYRDRIDYLLYDLKCYFAGQLTPMSKAYQNDNTKIWLQQFDHNFSNFVKKLRFENFVNKKFEVLDIEFGQKQVVRGNLERLQVNAKDKTALKQYLEQLLQLNIKGRFSIAK